MSSIIYRFLPVKVRTDLLDIYIYEGGLCNLFLRISRTEWIESYPWEAHYICFIFNAFSFLFLTPLLINICPSVLIGSE